MEVVKNIKNVVELRLFSYFNYLLFKAIFYLNEKTSSNDFFKISIFDFLIGNTRETYGLSQRAFSKLLKWGEVTMNRYEMGAIQDKAHNNILILLKKPENMLNILNNNLGVLSCSKEKQLREKIDLL